jgi:Ala-tRNA(Pro) deacylase
MQIDPYETIIQALEGARMAYQRLEHEPVFTSEQAAAVRGLSLSQGAKALLFQTKAGYVLVVLPGDRRVDSKKLRKLLGVSDVRFASPEAVKQLMGCEIGSCYPLGFLAGLRTLMDASLGQNDTISFNPGRHDVSIVMAYRDYLALAKPEIVSVV